MRAIGACGSDIRSEVMVATGGGRGRLSGGEPVNSWPMLLGMYLTTLTLGEVTDFTLGPPETM